MEKNMQQKEKIYIRNRYKIETILDSGGFGITYLASGHGRFYFRFVCSRPFATQGTAAHKKTEKKATGQVCFT